MKKQFFAQFGPPKTEKSDFLTNLDLPNLAESVFEIPKGHLLICSIPFTWGIHLNKNLLPARCVYNVENKEIIEMKEF